MKLRGRKVFITGATSGIGRALACLASERGAKVVAHGRSRERLQELLVSDARSGVTAVAGDLLTEQGLVTVETAIRDERPDILILNAGYNSRKAFASQWSDKEVSEMVSVNLISPILCSRAFVGLPKESDPRRLAVVLSTSCHHVRQQMSLYIACKTGLMGFGKVLQQEAKELGVRTTLFYPGRTNTAFRDDPHPEYMDPDSVAEAILDIMTLPSDLVPYEFTFRPPVDTTI
jgi:uncharacterized oxidoreductase